MPIFDTLNKRCSACELELSFEDFAKRRSGKLGLVAKCRVCSAIAAKRRCELNAHTLYPLTKTCSKCKLELPSACFSKDIHQKGGLSYSCKTCGIDRVKKYKEENKEKMAESAKKRYDGDPDKYRLKAKKWRDRNGDKIKKRTEENKDRTKKYYEENRPKFLELNKKWYRKNIAKVRVLSKEYREKNKDKIRTEKAEYTKKRLGIDIQFRIRTRLRDRFNKAMQGNYKNGSAVQDLGCSVDFLKQYLESQFTEGMTWENWGKGHGKWQIDHIVPMSAFDLTDRQQVLLACHYGNLQPLWFEDNERKLDKIPTWENYRDIHKTTEQFQEAA